MADFSLGVAELGTQVSMAGLEKGLSDAESVTKEKAGGISGFFGNAFAFATGGLIQKGIETLSGAVTGFFSGMIGDAREANQIMAQTEAVIRSTGGAAGFSAEQIADMASSLSAASGKSLFDDADIEKGQNLLLTFTNIKETLPDATGVLVDMAQAMGTDVKSSAIQLGKALNDPIAGISALSRVGVTFDDQQKRVINRLVKTGDVAGAQRIILAELNKEFGGSAAAAASADGGWAQFNARIGEAKEAIGTALLPLLGQIAGLLNDTVAPIIETAAARFGDLMAAFQTGAEGGDFIGGLTNALYSLDSVSPVFDTIADGINLIAGLADDAFGEGGGLGVLVDDVREMTGLDLSPVVGQFQGLTATFTDARDPITGFLDVLSEISPTFALLQGVAQETLPQIQALVTTVFGDTAAFLEENGPQMLGEVETTFQSIQDTVTSLIGPLAEVVNAVLAQISAFWAANGQDILATVQADFSEINSIIQDAMELIKLTVGPALEFVAQLINDHGAEIQAVFSAVWENIKAVIDVALALIGGIIRTALALVKGDTEGAWNEVEATVDRVWADIKTIVDNTIGPLVGVIKGAWEDIKTSSSTTWDGIKSTVSTKLGELETTIKELPGKLVGVGAAIVNEVWNGLQARWDQFMADLRSKLQDVRNMLPFSEPKDSSSPLYGLSDAGAAIITQIGLGIEQASGVLPAAIAGIGDDTVDTFGSILDSIGDAIGDSSTPDDAQQLGNDIIAGLVDGVFENLSDATSAMEDAAGEMLASAQDALGIASPSTVFADIGEMSMLGLLGGLEGMLPDLLEGIGTISTELITSMSDMTEDAKKEAEGLVDSLAGIMEDLPDKVHSALADAFDATASIDRQKARNIQALQDIGAAAIDIGGGMQELFAPERFRGIIQGQLAEAEQAAAALNDPEQAAKFYKLRSQQIFELAKLQQDMASAQTDAERASLRQQIADIQKAQKAEQAAFGQRAQITNSSSLGALADQLQTVLNAVPDAGQNPIWMQLYELLVQINSAQQPPAPSSGGASAGFLSSSAGSAFLAAGGVQQTKTISISIDARGAIDARAVEDAGYRGAKRALDEAGVKADVYKRTRR